MIVVNNKGQYVQSWEHYKLVLTSDRNKAKVFVEWVAKGNAKLLSRTNPNVEWFIEKA